MADAPVADAPPPDVPVSAKRRRRSPGPLIGWIVAALLLGGIIGALIVWATRSSPAPVTDAACVSTDVASKVLPSVVTVIATHAGGSGNGSGEIIRPDGYILTNNHVISPAVGAGGKVSVLLNDGSEHPATIVGRDPQTDLAVLKASGVNEPKVIAIASSSNVRVGQPVVALGAPLGLSSTVTDGIVSALGRAVHVPAENNQRALLVDAIQTDAAINPGNSGGALVDCSGNLVGVPTAGAAIPNPNGGASAGGNIGIGFAIPSDLAVLVSNEIIETGSVSHAYFGLQAVPVSPAQATQTGATVGLLVRQVTPGGPASAAGLHAGDVITKINGSTASSADQLMALTLTKRAGDKVTLAYRRQGQDGEAVVVLSARPS